MSYSNCTAETWTYEIIAFSLLDFGYAVQHLHLFEWHFKETSTKTSFQRTPFCYTIKLILKNVFFLRYFYLPSECRFVDTEKPFAIRAASISFLSIWPHLPVPMLGTVKSYRLCKNYKEWWIAPLKRINVLAWLSTQQTSSCQNVKLFQVATSKFTARKSSRFDISNTSDMTSLKMQSQQKRSIIG